MPFVEFPEEDVSVWYRTNLPGDGSAHQLDRTRPTILLLHGTIFDSTGLIEQFQDPRLRDHFNLVAPDHRSAGGTRNEPAVSRDGWTDAAGLVKVIDRLQLPPVHIFACCAISVHAALRIAMLWPDRCLSLTLVSIQRETDEQWVMDAWKEVVGMFSAAPDLETMEEAILEIISYAFGDFLSEEKKDHFAMYVETQYPPTRATRFMGFALTVFDRVQPTVEEFALIKLPVVIINGENFVCPLEDSERLRDKLVNVAGGAKLHIIPHAPEALYFPPQFAGTVNTLLLDFLAALPRPSATTAGTSMATALAHLAKLKDDPSIASRDPALVESFSCVPQAMREVRAAMFAHAEKAQQGAFCPAEPLRKFSERHDQQQFRPTVACFDHSWAQGVNVLVDAES